MKINLISSTALTLALAANPVFADITIGVAGPMTGQYASFGAQVRAGAEMAVADINAAGGVNGEALVLKVGDDACDPKQAVAVANQFAAEGIAFVAGHWCSGSSIPASAVYAEEGIIQIAHGSTNPVYTDERPGPGVLRICGRDDDQGRVAAEFLLQKFPDARVAFVHDKTGYGEGLVRTTLARYEAGGRQAVLTEAITAGEKDYMALVSKLNAAGVDILYFGGFHTEAGLLARQMREQGMDAIVFSGDGLTTAEYWAITGEAGAGTLLTFSPDPRREPEAAVVVERFRTAGIEPEGYVLYSYAAVQTWAQAAQAAGSADFDAVVKSLYDTRFNTVLGEMGYNENGDATLPGYVVYEWQDGNYDYYAR